MAPKELDGLGGDREQFYRAALERLFPAEREYLPDKVRGPVPCTQDGRKELLHLRIPGNPQLCKLRVAIYGGQDIIEVVRYTARQRANGIHLLRLPDLLLEAHPLRYVMGDPNHPERSPVVRVPQHLPCLFDYPDFTVRPNQPMHDCVALKIPD